MLTFFLRYSTAVLLVVLIASGAASGVDVTKAVGDPVSFRLDKPLPPSVSIICWKHRNSDGVVVKAIEWDEDGLFIPNPRFQGITTLDVKTGQITITDLKVEHSGVYTIEINSKPLEQRFTLTVKIIPSRTTDKKNVAEESPRIQPPSFPVANQADSRTLFDNFVQAKTCKETQQNFDKLCSDLDVDRKDFNLVYSKLKDKLNYWKAKELWEIIDKRGAHQDYKQGKACDKNKCLVLGAGPCGLRMAIELALLGARVVVLEKRESFTRNNVLHLWPYTVEDLKNLGAKKFYGGFGSGSIDHISTRQLQLILLKVALILGVEVHTGVTFEDLREPSGPTGWRAKVSPESHTAAAFEFDVFISAAGAKYVPDGFKRSGKKFRERLAIGITANFVNHHTKEENQVPETGGMMRKGNERFFENLKSEKGIDLENIVYYRDETHYFVMTAEKESLIKRGVIKQDFSDDKKLLESANVNQEALKKYALDAANFCTNQMLLNMEFVNNADHPDVSIFDFTSLQSAESASLVKERQGKKLLIGLVGDSLIEPFWPLGTGIGRGFLGVFDAAWMVRRWGDGVASSEVQAEREILYKIIKETTLEDTSMDFNAYSMNYSDYSIDPSTRYLNVTCSLSNPHRSCMYIK